MIKTIIAILLISILSVFNSYGINKNIYHNPIILSDYSDPDVIKVGNFFYMTSSSFNMVPGLPILQSSDLVNWTLIGHAINKLPDAFFEYKKRDSTQLDYNVPRPGMGVWAPSIRFHEGYFWIYFGDPDGGLYMLKSRNPETGWSSPKLICKASGLIDPCPIWDTVTHKAYISFANADSRRGIKERIEVCEMSWDGTKLLGPSTIIFDANDSIKFKTDRFHKFIEGTKFYHIDDWYYVLCPAGGVSDGWQTALRSKNPLGPYEIKTIIETGNTNINGPHQGALIESEKDSWWFIHFQSTGTLGRIVWLQPVKWIRNWPIIGRNNNNIGNPIISYNYPLTPKKLKIQTSDEFNGSKLGLQWQWPANPQEDWYTIENGSLLLPARFLDANDLNKIPNILTQKFNNYAITATTLMSQDSDGIRSGLVALGRKSFDIGFENKNDSMLVSVRYQGKSLESAVVKKQDIWLRMKTFGELPLPLQKNNKKFSLIENDSLYKYEDLDGYINGKIFCQFSFSLDGSTFTDIGTVYELRSGVWIGAKMGIFCTKKNINSIGVLRVDYVRIDD